LLTLRKGEIGTACTSVVTEYRQRGTRHTAPITIEVERLTALEISELVKELVYSYRQFYVPNLEDAASDSEYSHYETESAHAWAILETAFKHKGRFGECLLQDRSPGAPDKIIEQLVEWTQDLPWPEGGHSDIWEAVSAEECNSKTAEFMNDRLWPFTRMIR
jgi:hypothetical protein